jgi:CRISPR type III-B/RAMP module RAMP protein Cmr1
MPTRGQTQSDQHDLQQLQAALLTPNKSSIRWLLHARPLTPTVGGGTTPNKPDAQFAVRPTQIKAGVRAWWRFIKKLDGGSWAQVRQEEQRIFGSASINKEGHASLVRVSVVQPEGRLQSREYKRGHTGIFLDVSAGFQPFEFELQFEFILNRGGRAGLSVLDTASVREAIAWWSTFSGIGSKTAKGYGKFELFEACQNDSLAINEGLVKTLLAPQTSSDTTFNKAVDRGWLNVSALGRTGHKTAEQAINAAAIALKTFRAEQGNENPQFEFRGLKSNENFRKPNPIIFIPCWHQGSWRVLAALCPADASELKLMRWDETAHADMQHFISVFHQI